MVVRRGDIRAPEATKTADVVDASWNGRGRRNQKHVRNSVQAVILVWDIGILPIEGVVSSSLRRLRDVRYQIVDLNAGLEGVAAKDLGHTVRPFDAVDGLNRRGEIAYANMGQSIDGDGGNATVLRDLRYASDTVLGGDAEGVSID